MPQSARALVGDGTSRAPPARRREARGRASRNAGRGGERAAAWRDESAPAAWVQALRVAHGWRIAEPARDPSGGARRGDPRRKAAGAFVAARESSARTPEGACGARGSNRLRPTGARSRSPGRVPTARADSSRPPAAHTVSGSRSPSVGGRLEPPFNRHPAVTMEAFRA